MPKNNTNALTHGATVRWRRQRHTVVIIASMPTMFTKPKFSVIANTLRAHWANSGECALRVRGSASQIFRIRTATHGLP
jgi:hypothetical protein